VNFSGKKHEDLIVADWINLAERKRLSTKQMNDVQ